MKYVFTLLVTLLFSSLVMGQSIEVTADQNLNDAILYANNGYADTLILATDGGVYEMHPDSIMVPMVIVGKEGLTNKPIIRPKNVGAGDYFIWVRNDLTLRNLIIDGYDPTTATYDSIRYLLKVMGTNEGPNPTPDLTVQDCELKNVYKYGDPETSKDGNFFDISKQARCGDVLFENTTFMNSGDEALRAINTHKEPVLDNRVWDSFTVRNCTFVNIRGTCIKIESDADSTTYDGEVLIENCTMYKCQRRVVWEREFVGSIVRNLIIANSIIGNDTWDAAHTLITTQREQSVVAHIDTFQIVKVIQNPDGSKDTLDLSYGAFVGEVPSSWSKAHGVPFIDTTTIYGYDPMFEDPENYNFTLKEGSPLYTLAHDGGPLGDRRWAKYWTGIESQNSKVPGKFTLQQNYPNPFNPSTTIVYELDKTAQISIDIYDATGKKIRTLFKGEKSAGKHSISFNAKDLASGVYFYRISDGTRSLVKKMLLMK
ncbi:MAG: T9SS C-terminal target domain-containing protein [Calditrichaeota bacterium]|nr:MAG: T9SS C-terminal target domain-containing protein [Calditrichota bacterium]